jgi:hypothetical protein
MSDYDDEMDVDAPSKDVQFSAESAGKKRTAADLPVEAQDNLPWSAMLPGWTHNFHSNACTGSKSTGQIR